jgi:hypothetical protein
MAVISSLEQFLDASVGWLSPQAAMSMITWKPNPQLRARMEELGHRANEGLLTSAEQEEYEQFIDDEDVISLLQAKARQIVAASHP